MAFKYSVILPVLALGGGDVWERPREVLKMIARAGYDGIDIDAEPDRIDQRRFREVTEMAGSLGLKVAGVLGAWGTWHAGEQRDLASSDESVRQYAVNYCKKCIDLSASLGGPVFQIMAVCFHHEYPFCSTPLGTLRHNFVRSAKEIADYAAPRQVPVAIEPINRFEGYAGFLNSVVDAMSIVDEVDVSCLGVMIDFFHANIEDGSLSDVMRMAGNKLLHIHLADSNRQAPGTGHIDFLQVVRTLSAMEYKRYMALDCIPPRPDLETFLGYSISYMREMEKALALQKRLYESH